MESFEVRLKKFGKHLGSASKLAEELDMSAPALQSYTNGRSKPGYNIIMKLHNLGCNINWLLSGNGDMLLHNNTASQNPVQKELIELNSTHRKKQDYTMIDKVIQLGCENKELKEKLKSGDTSAEIRQLEFQIEILKVRISEKDDFIKMLLDRQDFNIKPNINRTA